MIPINAVKGFENLASMGESVKPVFLALGAGGRDARKKLANWNYATHNGCYQLRKAVTK